MIVIASSSKTVTIMPTEKRATLAGVEVAAAIKEKYSSSIDVSIWDPMFDVLPMAGDSERNYVRSSLTVRLGTCLLSIITLAHQMSSSPVSLFSLSLSLILLAETGSRHLHQHLRQENGGCRLDPRRRALLRKQ